MPAKSCFRWSLQFIALPLRFRAKKTNGGKRAVNTKWWNGGGYCHFYPSDRKRLSRSWARHERMTDRSFLFWKIRRIPGTASHSFGIPCTRRRVSSVGDWMAGANNFPAYLGRYATRKHRRDERKRARDSRAFTETQVRRRQWLLCLFETDTCLRKPGRRRIEKRTSLGYRANNKQLHTRFIDFAVATRTFLRISHARNVQKLLKA